MLSQDSTRKPRIMRFAMGNMGKNALASMLEVYGLFYCTEVLGIAPQVAGLIILASLFWDAIVDPLIGLWADRQIAGRQSVARLLLLGMPITAVSFLAFFRLHWFDASLQVPLAVVLLIIFRAAYTLVDVPHNSLLVLAAHTSAERKKLASLRILFSGAGKISLTIAAAWWLSRDGFDVDAALEQTSLAMIAVFVVALSICIHSVGGLSEPPGKASEDWKPIQALTAMFRSHSQLRVAFFLTAINSASIPAASVVLIYCAKYQLGDAEIGANALVLQAAIQALMPVVWERMTRHDVPTQRTLAFAYVSLIAFCVTGLVMPMSNASLLLLAAGSGASIAGIFMLNWVFFADALASAKLKAETDATISAFGLYSVINKIFHGFAQALAGIILALALKDGNGLTSEFSIPLHTPFLGTILIGSTFALSVLAHSRK